MHLPANCLASSEADTKGKFHKYARLSLDNLTVEEVYAGKIHTWEELLAAQGTDGKDAITCEHAAELKETIKPVVRLDKSGTTHIFKSYLAQIYKEPIAMEAFNEVHKEHPCPAPLPAGEKLTWEHVQEGCENQRWPEEAHVVRPGEDATPEETGNPGVLHAVNTLPSSMGYADLAVAEELGYFDAPGEGGESKKGEKNHKFWVELQDTKLGAATEEFADPSTKGDTNKAANSNCKSTVYANAAGEEFPPASTRNDWSKVKGQTVSKTYALCGLTYELALRQYYPYEKAEGDTKEDSLKKAQTVHDFLLWALNSKSEGGGFEAKNLFYEPLPKAVLKEAETGVKEIGNEVG